MPATLLDWHDFNVSLVTASAALLGLLFVALSIHMRTLAQRRSAELRSIARTVFLGYVVALGIGFLELVPQTMNTLGIEMLVLLLVAIVPFGEAARAGLRASGLGFDRRVTIGQFIFGFVLFIITIAASIGIAVDEPRALYVMAGVAVLSLLWGVFNTYELIFRVQSIDN